VHTIARLHHMRFRRTVRPGGIGRPSRRNGLIFPILTTTVLLQYYITINRSNEKQSLTIVHNSVVQNNKINNIYVYMSRRSTGSDKTALYD